VILLRAFRRRSRGVSALTDPSRFLDDLPADLIEGDLIGMRTAAQAVYARETTWQGRAKVPIEARYQAGMRVTHPQFGEGIVLETQMEFDDEEVTVNFEGAGIKHLVASMANLEIEDQ
jgi:DNA helicase-2/ATP-dependent DNA helicase PcrA